MPSSRDNDFDRLARWYRGLELVLAGPTLQRLRRTGLATLARCSHILIVGDGPGRGTELILRAAPDARVTVVEKSPRMLEVA